MRVGCGVCRNLAGDDLLDCSMLFFYALCGLALRDPITKILGFAPPRGLVNFIPEMQAVQAVQANMQAS